MKPLVQAATDQGRMDGGTPLTISMVFKKTAAQEAALEKLLADQQDLSSPNYHKWLTPQQFADRFGMSPGDIATVSSWLRSQGLKVERVANSRTQVWFSGPVSKIETVFRTEMHQYQLKGERHFANATELSVPASLGDVVLGFHNMDDFRPKARVKMHAVSADQVTSHFTSNLTGNHFLTPGDFATIYDLPTGFDGTGQTLVVVGQTALTTNGSAVTDIDAFRSAAGLPTRTASNFIMTLMPGTGSSVVSDPDIGEASLDVEWSEGVAHGVKQNYVYVGNSTNFSVFDALQYAIDNNSTIKASVISISYGNCEQMLGAASVAMVQGWAQQANAQGQTITAASGDFGAADCDASPNLPAEGGIAVDIPAGLPYVTGVGGTEFTGDAAGAVTGTAPASCAANTPYWKGNCNLTGAASAISYIPETTWNDTVAASSLSASGGGASIFFSKPSWQTGTGVPNDGARDVPDVALAASPNHDAYLLCATDPTSSVGPCIPAAGATPASFRDSSNNLNAAGGTSFGAPSFAGIVAILNQKTGSNGLGNVNPTLYAIAASTPTAFHDITSGNNIVPCGAGTPNCPTTGTAQYGFSAGTGYDQVTGLGTIDANVLAGAWSSGNPTTADYSMFGTVSSISAPGGTGSSTITVDARNGFSGTVTLSCTPPTSVFITCSLSSSSIALSSGTTTGTSTLTIKTNSTAGLHREDAPLAPFFAGGGAVFAGVFVLGLRNRRRSVRVALTLLTIAFLLAAVGCGGSSHSGGGGSTTPAGSYNVTVTGTSGSTTHTTNVSVVVQ